MVPDAKAAAAFLEKKFIAVEENLHQLRLTGRGQHGVRWSTQLAGQITYLTNGIASSDFAPTTQPVEVDRLFEERVRRHRTEINASWSRDLAEFHTMLREKGIQGVVAKTP